MRTNKGYLPHIWHRGEQSVIKINGCNNHRHHAKRRWIVETTNSWHNRFRKLLVRYEKKLGSYFALVVCLGCCIVIYRRIIWDSLSQFFTGVFEYGNVGNHRSYGLMPFMHICISIDSRLIQKTYLEQQQKTQMSMI
jgi:hypothetical protein